VPAASRASSARGSGASAQQCNSLYLCRADCPPQQPAGPKADKTASTAFSRSGSSAGCPAAGWTAHSQSACGSAARSSGACSSSAARIRCRRRQQARPPGENYHRHKGPTLHTVRRACCQSRRRQCRPTVWTPLRIRQPLQQQEILMLLGWGNAVLAARQSGSRRSCGSH